MPSVCNPRSCCALLSPVANFDSQWMLYAVISLLYSLGLFFGRYAVILAERFSGSQCCRSSGRPVTHMGQIVGI